MDHFSAELGTPKKGQRLPSLQGRNACPFSSLSSSAWNVHIFTKNVLHLQPGILSVDLGAAVF